MTSGSHGQVEEKPIKIGKLNMYKYIYCFYDHLDSYPTYQPLFKFKRWKRGSPGNGKRVERRKGFGKRS